MSLELLGRVHKELSITGSALYEAILAIAERVNRKVQIIRLHWQASRLLERMDRVSGDVGQEIVDHLTRRRITNGPADSGVNTLDGLLHRATAGVQDLKRSLIQIDAQIRGLKLEAIHQELLHLQRDLSLRSAAIERLSVHAHARAVGQPVSACPRSSSVHIVTILRGPSLLAPEADVVFRPDDLVVLIGLQSDMDDLVAWFTGPRSVTVSSAPAM